jgi:hypothetical protein
MEDMSHHWILPLVPSLADRWRGLRAGETLASVLSPAAHAGSLTIAGGAVSGANKKTLEVWLSRVTARSLSGENQSSRASGLSLPSQ